MCASRCHGWTVLDVIVHVRTGLDEMLRGIVSVTTDRPDTDPASYWSTALPTADSPAEDVDAILWPRTAVAHLRDVATAVDTAARRTPDGPIRFQGHVPASGDFLTRWAVELAVHHLDIAAHLELAPPTERALELSRASVEALLDATLPRDLDDSAAVLLGTGRLTRTPSRRDCSASSRTACRSSASDTAAPRRGPLSAQAVHSNAAAVRLTSSVSTRAKVPGGKLAA